MNFIKFFKKIHAFKTAKSKKSCYKFITKNDKNFLRKSIRKNNFTRFKQIFLVFKDTIYSAANFFKINHTESAKFIKKTMDNLYNDELLPESFEQMAKAYSKTLKDKGFVFIRLDEEEFELLLSEIFVIIAKMQACIIKLERYVEGKILFEKLDRAKEQLACRFGKKKPHKFICVENENSAFLSLVALYGTLNIKLMLLAVKSGELELCNQISVSISGVFAESFSLEGFKPQIN